MATRKKSVEKKQNIFLFSGRKQAGKDTASEVLQEKGFLRLSFAQGIKDMVTIQNPIIATEMTVRLDDGRTITRQGAFHLQDFLNAGHTMDELKESHAEVRRLLQVTGTEVGRALDPDIWVKSVVKTIKANPDRDVVITDGRFPNEIEAIHALGGVSIYVQNDVAEAVPATHDSEKWAGKLGEKYTVDNNGTVEELHAQIESILEELNG